MLSVQLRFGLDSCTNKDGTCVKYALAALQTREESGTRYITCDLNEDYNESCAFAFHTSMDSINKPVAAVCGVFTIFLARIYFSARCTYGVHSVCKFRRDLCNDSAVTMYTEKSGSAKM